MQVLRVLARLMQQAETLDVDARQLWDSLDLVDDEGNYLEVAAAERKTEDKFLTLYAAKGGLQRAEVDLMRDLRDVRPRLQTMPPTYLRKWRSSLPRRLKCLARREKTS
eukprot:GHVS01067443.1.p2 GENE.GHVS01067443.1~~GHVS01067443.1.p2  ORF type:complete len:109 (-),score=7.02 GHVS01067443.1:332-658(-)